MEAKSLKYTGSVECTKYRALTRHYGWNDDSLMALILAVDGQAHMFRNIFTSRENLLFLRWCLGSKMGLVWGKCRQAAFQIEFKSMSQEASESLEQWGWGGLGFSASPWDQCPGSCPRAGSPSAALISSAL